jgi:K+-sensing histidine kinase KdpD
MLLPQKSCGEAKALGLDGIQTQINPNRVQQEPYAQTMSEPILNMLKIMSHDLRGSLLSMMATLKLLNRGYYGEADENMKFKLEELFGKVKVLTGMTEEYLGRAFSVNGDLEMERETLDLKEDIINPVLEEFSSEIRDCNIHVDNRLDVIKHPISAKGSKVWLKSVFRNLLKNAINYGKMGGSIVLGFEDHGSMYRLNVYNSGEPVPEGLRDKLFSRFIHNGKNDNGKSNRMGLGLHFVQMIIRKHGGDIRYEAKEHGSNFVVDIPHEGC